MCMVKAGQTHVVSGQKQHVRPAGVAVGHEDNNVDFQTSYVSDQP